MIVRAVLDFDGDFYGAEAKGLALSAAVAFDERHGSVQRLGDYVWQTADASIITKACDQLAIRHEIVE